MEFDNVTLREVYDGFSSDTKGILTIDGEKKRIEIRCANSGSKMSFCMSDLCLPLNGPAMGKLALQRSEGSSLDRELWKIEIEGEMDEDTQTIHEVFTNFEWGNAIVRVHPSDVVEDITLDDSEDGEENERKRRERDAMREWGPEGPSLSDVAKQTQPTEGARRVVPSTRGVVDKSRRKDNSIPSNLFVMGNGEVVGGGQRGRGRGRGRGVSGRNVPSSPSAGVKRQPFGGIFNGTGQTTAGAPRPDQENALNERMNKMDAMINRVNKRDREKEILDVFFPPAHSSTVDPTTRFLQNVNTIDVKTIGAVLANTLNGGLPLDVPPLPKRIRLESVEKEEIVEKREMSTQTETMEMCGECERKNGMEGIKEE